MSKLKIKVLEPGNFIYDSGEQKYSVIKVPSGSDLEVLGVETLLPNVSLPV